MEQDTITAQPMGLEAMPEPEVALSAWSLFIGAEPIVQGVILLLVFASFWSWAIIFQKFFRLKQIKAAAVTFEDSFWSGGSLDDLYERVNNTSSDPMSSLFCAAMKEWRRSTTKGLPAKGLKETVQQRIERIMHITQNRELDYLERHLGFLATTGSTAVFVGLFGTVLGIIHSFESIAAQQSTNLAVVAPGIAEALFATAVGLAAAIPAVVAYNKLTSELARYANKLETFATEFSAIVSRQLEEAA